MDLLRVLSKNGCIISLFFYLSFSSLYAVNKDVYAKKILKSTQHVIKKENVLGVPDKKYAELMYKANLDVKFDKHVINRDGDDIKVFAKKIRIESEPNTMAYDLYAKKEKNDSWTYLGNGFVGTLDSITKNTSFDLKSLDSAMYFRVIYQTDYYNNKPQNSDDVIGIDALKSLNK